jgi:hypothetical protein
MKDISTVEIKIQTEFLKNKVKEIRNLREKEMSKKSKMVNEKALPETIDNVYNAVFGLLSAMVKKEPIEYSKYFNYLIEIVTNYGKIPSEIDQDGIKSYIVEKLTFDVLELLKSEENKQSYGIEYIVGFIDSLFDIVKSVIETKSIDYAELFSFGYSSFRNYKNIMNEFNDLDNNEISQLAGLVAYKIIG